MRTILAVQTREQIARVLNAGVLGERLLETIAGAGILAGRDVGPRERDGGRRARFDGC